MTMDERAHRRDQFAMAALTGLLANRFAEARYAGNLIEAAREAWAIGDEMLALDEAPPMEAAVKRPACATCGSDDGKTHFGPITDTCPTCGATDEIPF